MTTLTVRLDGMDGIRKRIAKATSSSASGELVPTNPVLNFSSYEDLHRILTPSRLAIVMALAGQGCIPIRGVARMVRRGDQAVRRDVKTLVDAGVIDRTAAGIEFPFRSIRFEFGLDFTV